MPLPSDREAKLQALLAEAQTIVQGFADLDKRLTWLEDTVHKADILNLHIQK